MNSLLIMFVDAKFEFLTWSIAEAMVFFSSFNNYLNYLLYYSNGDTKYLVNE